MTEISPVYHATMADQAKFFFTLLLIRPQGAQGGGSTDLGETIEFEFLGSRCDRLGLGQLEPKNSSKSAEIHQKCLFLSSFWVPLALNLHGRI